MSDIKDILGISRDASAGASRPRAPKPSVKKPEGMSREVFALLHQDGGGSTVPLAPTSAAVNEGLLKEKRARMVGWEWKEFHNSGRTDGLRLSHWARNNDKSTEYTFARFNKPVRPCPAQPPHHPAPALWWRRDAAGFFALQVRLLSYTDEEYARHLVHPAWNKAESDLLFELCRRFDLRWPVIHDRFESPTPKPVEQLKERYYDMCKNLLAARAEAGEAEAAAHPLLKFK
jgi:DNA methyltransferase 1-associated protein 1